MKIVNMMVSEISPTKKPHAVWFQVCEISGRGKSIDTKISLVVARRAGRGELGLTTNRYRVSF